MTLNFCREAQAKTSIDWFRFRTQASPLDALEALRPLFGTHAHALSLKRLERGILGFSEACLIEHGGVPLGRMDFGGESQRGWLRLDLSGKGCGWVSDWSAVDALESLPASEIRRVDLALTTWEGQIGHDTVVEAHAAGRFITGGRPPSMQTVVSTDGRAGKTCYVGRRDSDKFFRGYEKGFEMAKSFPPSIQIDAIDGFPVEGIYRCEVELKASARPIEWDVIERRDHYFAGSYPFCSDVLPGVESDFLMRRPERVPQMELDAALATLRHQWGNTLFTALQAYHGDISAVWEKVIGHKHCEALLQSGVLLVEH